MIVSSRGGIPIVDTKRHGESLIKTSKRKTMFTTKECNKIQGYKIRTQDKSFHGTTKEINEE